MPLSIDARQAAQLFNLGDDGEAAKSRELVLALVDWSPEPFLRTTFTPGHITCTGCALSPDGGRILLVYHRRLGKWLLPGGHVEPDDDTLVAAARREVREETGVLLRPSPELLVGIDVHAIPSNGREPLHLHHDLIWGFHATSEAVICSEESRAVVWCAMDGFERYDLPGSIRRAAFRLYAAVGMLYSG